MLQIVLQNTNRRGSAWALGAERLVIGREEGCGIRVVDNAISRRHCAVWLEAGEARFEDLGARNAALVNGAPLRSGGLRVGDTLAVGPALFVISGAAPAPGAAAADSDPAPVTLSVRLGRYSAGADAAAAAGPQTVHELFELFQLARALGTVASVGALTEHLAGLLRERFAPQALWIAWRHGAEGELFWQATEGARVPDGAVAAVLRRALAKEEGVIEPGPRRRGDLAGQEMLMAVPLLHVEEALGGFVLQGRAAGAAYAKADLDYALGVAAIVAPHVHAVRHVEQLRRDHEALQRRVGAAGTLIGEGSAMRALRERLQRAARGRGNVLLRGETGTGKELAARFLHEHSARAQGPYVIINCAAIPGELFESEIFGHVEGAFNNAKARAGRLEEAHGGTLFLDEIADLAVNHQARILRAVESGEYARIGSNEVRHADVRFVAATNKRLETPEFRADLFQRLNGFSIDLPPLRERLEDIPALVQHFLAASRGRADMAIAPEALAKLQGYAWPGNVRELKKVVDAAADTAVHGVLRGEDVEEHLRSRDSEGATALPGEIGPLVTLAELERAHVLRVYRHCGGNIAAAARILGITRVTLYKRLQEALPGEL